MQDKSVFLEKGEQIEEGKYSLVFDGKCIDKKLGILNGSDIEVFSHELFEQICSHPPNSLVLTPLRVNSVLMIWFFPDKEKISNYKQTNAFYFEEIMLWLDKHDPQESYIQFGISFDAFNWDKPYSIKEYTEELLNQVLSDGWTITKDDISEVESGIMRLEGFLSDIPYTLPVNETLKKALDFIYEVNLTVLKVLEPRAIVQKFDFPEEVRTACEQYLLYFAEFLKDVGIEATAMITEEAENVIFSVKPKNKEEALENINKLLKLYLQLPSSSIAGSYQPTLETSLPVQRLNAQILHLQSQLTLANAERQMLNATIQQKDGLIAQQTQFIQSQQFSTEVLIKSIQENQIEEENLIGKIVRVKDYEAGPFTISLSELLRKIKEWVKS
jgi:hypothetical protein